MFPKIDDVDYEATRELAKEKYLLAKKRLIEDLEASLAGDAEKTVETASAKV